MTTKRLLYEILKDLSSEELEEFNLNVGLEKGVPLLSKHHPKRTNAEEVVELMVEKYSEECVELTKSVLKKMKRTDLVQRLSDSSAGVKEKHSVQTAAKQWSSLIQRVEMITSDIEVLMDILADLNEEEIQYFRNELKRTPIKTNESYVSRWKLVRTDPNSVFVGDHQETVFLIIMAYGQRSVEITREILEKMEKTDLMQRLSDTSSRFKKKDSDEQRSALIHKVATMAAVQQLLLETLLCLSQREIREFMEVLEQIVSQKGLRNISSIWIDRGERATLVDGMMRTYGQQCVELTREVLEKMKRTDLIQMLSESSSALKEKHSVVKHQPTSAAEAVKEDDEQILLQTLWGLSLKELEKFRFLLQFTNFQKSLPQIPWTQTNPAHQLFSLVDLMVKNQQPVEVTKEVLMDMNRSDLVERLSGTSSGLKEKSVLDWLQTVETATSVTELLMETLASLSEEEVQRFMTHLIDTWGLRYKLYNPWLLEGRDHQETVFSIIMSCGKHSVEKTREILKNMERTDLMQRLSDTSSTLRKKDSDEQRSALIHKVATMAAVQQLLSETLLCLSQREISEFKKVLEQIDSQKGLRTISFIWRDGEERAEIVDQMIRTYGQQCVELTREVLEKMKRTDLIQMLSESSSALKEKHSVDKHQPTSAAEAVKEDDEQILLQTLRGLSFKELEKFRILLQFTNFQKSLPQILWTQTEPVKHLFSLVALMVENQQPVEVTKEVLMDMNRSDLVERLSGTSSGLKEKSVLDWLQTVETVTSVTELLIETLADLSEEELQRFKTHLKLTWGWRYKLYNPWLLEGRDHQETVFSIIMSCSKHSVEITREILKNMKRTDLMQRLSDTSSTLRKKDSDEQRSALIHKVATMAAVQQLLLETLLRLSQREISEFKKVLKQIDSQKGLRTISFIWRDGEERAEIVDQMIRTYGQQCVELTREVLEKMKRTDLIQMLSESSSALKEKHSVVKHQPTLLETAVKEDDEQILLQTLRGLSFKELEKFRILLQFTNFQKSLPQIPWTQTEPMKQEEELVALMLKNQQPVEVTKEVLMDLNRSDLVERLSGTSSGLKGESQSDRLQKEPSSHYWTVFKTLRGLSSGEFVRFKQLMQQTAPGKGLQGAVHGISREDRAGMAELMVEIYGQQSVEVTADVLQKMKNVLHKRKRTDLMWTSSETSSGLKTQKKHQSKRPRKESTMTADHVQLLEILEKLSPVELEKFKHVLQYSKLGGLPEIPGSSMETVDKAETVRLMVENYGQQCVEVTKDVLERIKRMDLVEKLSESSSGSQGPSGSLEPEVCGRSTPDSSLWTKLEPGVNRSGGDESPTYSLQCETGNFECRVSGLRWVCKEEVFFQYHFCSWGGLMERMENINYTPAGPLMDITVITGSFNEVYLPHWICTEDDSKISDNFAVLHIDDCGDVVENVSEVTPSHVKLSEPVFSPRGIILYMQRLITWKIKCSVLIYHKPNKPFLKLRVYLIPCDPALQQTVDRKELSKGFQKIEKPRPDTPLKIQQGFSLTADINTAEINPQEITLDYDFQDPNFYEVFIEKPDRDFKLSLSYTSKKEVQSEPVWTCKIRKDDHQNPASEDKPSVDDHLSARMQRAVTIDTTDRERLLKTLQALKQEEFKMFKWFLQDRGVLAGLQSISRSELENKDMLDLVDLMLGTYRAQCVELTRRVLREMNKNDLVETLSDNS